MNQSKKSATDEQADYDIEQMTFLNDLEHVRLRSAMYIGDLNEDGLHHLVHEVIDNSIDEAMAGHATKVVVIVREDNSISVEDDGRGIPVAFDRNIEKSALEGAMTVLKYSAKFDNNAYDRPGGLHGMGLKAVNFLSEWCRVTVCRNGYEHQQEYRRGEPVKPVEQLAATDHTGTKTEFLPDREKFGDLVFDFDNLRRRLQDMAFLNSGVAIEFIDTRRPERHHEVFKYERGLVDFVEHRNQGNALIHSDVVCVSDELDDVAVSIAFQYIAKDDEVIDCYANNIHNREGGAHLKGFRSGLVRCLRAYGNQNKLFRKTQPISEDFREGLIAVVSVRVASPEFESQHKLRLTNKGVESKVGAIASRKVSEFLEENPKTAEAILKRVVVAAEARELARAKKEAIETTSRRSGNGLPGKLRDCSSTDVSLRELYLVEGDSAGGSAEGGRLKETQAILPLRGKLINAIKSRDDRVLAHEEVQSIIQAIGIGIGVEQDLTKRRYEKVIIMTDADVDGSHIRTLLLCFFYRQMYALIEAGHVYVAQPPLFRVRSRHDTHYVQTESEMRGQLVTRGLIDSVLITDSGRELTSDELKTVCEILVGLEEPVASLARGGINLKSHAQKVDAVTGLLPAFRFEDDRAGQWVSSIEEVPQGVMRRIPVEYTEIRAINTGLQRLARFGFDVSSLFPKERTGVETPRYELRHGDQTIPLDDLRGLVSAVRKIGEKGLHVTRFKGLGEMNADELRETTLDPLKRSLVQITMDDVAAADQMFQLLMGNEVRPRRDFIEDHALDVERLDV